MSKATAGLNSLINKLSIKYSIEIKHRIITDDMCMIYMQDKNNKRYRSAIRFHKDEDMTKGLEYYAREFYKCIRSKNRSITVKEYVEHKMKLYEMNNFELSEFVYEHFGCQLHHYFESSSGMIYIKEGSDVVYSVKYNNKWPKTFFEKLVYFFGRNPIEYEIRDKIRDGYFKQIKRLEEKHFGSVE